MPIYPDEELEHLEVSIRQFNGRACNLWKAACERDRNGGYIDPPYDSPERWYPFARFVLAGRDYMPNEDPARIFLQPRYDHRPMAEGDYQVTRDFDSLIGICRTFPFNCGMAFFPVPDFSYTMTRATSNHLKVAIHRRQGVVGDNGVSPLLSLPILIC